MTGETTGLDGTKTPIPADRPHVESSMTHMPEQWQAICSCGWKSAWTTSEFEADDALGAHTDGYCADCGGELTGPHARDQWCPRCDVENDDEPATSPVVEGDR